MGILGHEITESFNQNDRALVLNFQDYSSNKNCKPQAYLPRKQFREALGGTFSQRSLSAQD